MEAAEHHHFAAEENFQLLHMLHCGKVDQAIYDALRTWHHFQEGPDPLLHVSPILQSTTPIILRY